MKNSYRSLKSYTVFRILNPRLALLTLFSLGLTGCSTSVEGFDAADDGLIKQYGSAVLKTLRESKHANVKVHWDTPWVKREPQFINRKSALPQEVDKQVVFSVSDPIDFRDFMVHFHAMSGMSLRLSLDAEAKLDGKLSMDVSSLGGGFAGSATDGGSVSSSYMISPFSYHGPTSGLLDKVSTDLGLFWKHSQGQVQLYYLDTRVFQVNTIATDNSLSVQINSSGNAESGSGAGGSGVTSVASGSASVQNATMSMKSNIIEDITANIEMLLTPGIGRASISAATGAITVCDTEDSLQKIEDYIDKENKLLNKQILVNVKVLSLDLTKSHKTQIDWNMAAKVLDDAKVDFSSSGTSRGTQLGLKYGAAADSGSPSVGGSGAGNELFSTLGSGAMLPWSLSLSSLNLFLKAISDQADITVLTSPSVTTLNLHHVPLQIGEQQSYVAKESTTVTKNTDGSKDTNVSLETNSISTGMSMSILPFAMMNNEILLQYSVNLSELLAMEKVTSGNDNGPSYNEPAGTQASLQLPKVSNRIFSQKVKIKSGNTLVISGFEQNKESSQASAPIVNNFLKYIWGTSNQSSTHNAILILITPIVLD